MITQKKNKDIHLLFTGERMIPDQNKGMALYYEHFSRYFFSLQLAKGKTVLDLASGSGYGSYFLSEHGKAKKVYGVDISQEAVNYASQRYKKRNVSFSLDDVKFLKSVSDASIDLALAFEIIEHLEKPVLLLKQIKRVLKNNGVCLISTPNKYTYTSKNNFHKTEYYPHEFSQLLKKFFKYVVFYHQCYTIAETIKPEIKPTFNFEDNFVYLEQDLYTEDINLKNSQYIIAQCSDSRLPSLKTSSIAVSKVDSFDFSKGIELCDLTRQLEELKRSNELLHVVQSSKFYKIWRKYCEIRELVFSKGSLSE